MNKHFQIHLFWKTHFKSLTKLSLLVLLSFTLVACGSQINNAQQNPEKYYNTYANTPTIIEIPEPSKHDNIEAVFAEHFAPLDKELEDLERRLESFLNLNDPKEASELLNRFPWLSNVLVLNSEGKILGAIPANSSKPLNFDYLNGIKVETRKVYSHVLKSSAGPEILLARPFIQSDELLGYIAVAFDIRSLLPTASNPENIIITTPNTVLWSGDYLYSETLLGKVDWNKMIDKKSYGLLWNKDFDAYWIVRYFADMHFIFGVIEPYTPE